MLDVDIERTVGVELERIAIPDGKAVNGIGGEISLIVVNAERPEGLHRRRAGFIEMNGVGVRAVQQLSRRIAQRRLIYRVFSRQSSAEVARYNPTKLLVRSIASVVAGRSPSCLALGHFAGSKSGQR